MSAQVLPFPRAPRRSAPVTLPPETLEYARLLSMMPPSRKRTLFAGIADNLWPGWRLAATGFGSAAIMPLPTREPRA